MCRTFVFVCLCIRAIIIAAILVEIWTKDTPHQSKSSSLKTLMLFVLFQVLRPPSINKTAKSNNFLMCFDPTACTGLFKWTFGNEPLQCTDSPLLTLTTGFSSRHLVLTTHLPILCILEVKVADHKTNLSSSQKFKNAWRLTSTSLHIFMACV